MSPRQGVLDQFLRKFQIKKKSLFAALGVRVENYCCAAESVVRSLHFICSIVDLLLLDHCCSLSYYQYLDVAAEDERFPHCQTWRQNEVLSCHSGRLGLFAEH
jgi:hypothetical protein